MKLENLNEKQLRIICKKLLKKQRGGTESSSIRDNYHIEYSCKSFKFKYEIHQGVSASSTSFTQAGWDTYNTLKFKETLRTTVKIAVDEIADRVSEKFRQGMIPAGLTTNIIEAPTNESLRESNEKEYFVVVMQTLYNPTTRPLMSAALQPKPPMAMRVQQE